MLNVHKELFSQKQPYQPTLEELYGEIYAIVMSLLLKLIITN